MSASNKASPPGDSSVAEKVDDPKRRRMLVLAAAGVGGLGTVALAAPMVGSMSPSARAKAAGAPVEADVSKLQAGQLMTVEWRGKPVWLVKRTDDVLGRLSAETGRLSDPDSAVETQQPDYAQNAARSIKPELLVVVGLCTHLGCSPSYRPEIAPSDLGADWDGGFFCPCHGSKFDLAGRVYSGVPAPTNLEIPPYRYEDDNIIVVGEDPGVAA
ncbi:MAG: ubiquinol-cytochrome c reductase iron-sulfur subunit [Granulosicoccus sp.]